MRYKEYLKNYIVYEDGNVYSKRKGRLLNQRVNSSGYVTLTINKVTTSAHRIIAMLFIENPNNKPCINHINGIKTDNRVSNLEWCTYSENNLHAYKTGLKKPSHEKGFQFRPNNKIVINTITNEVYNSVKQLLPHTNLKYSCLINKLNGSRKNDTIYQYIKTPN